jgi:GNAT superfamily N-acetyltransferase
VKSNADAESRVVVVPASADRWPDLEALFGARGACAGCWCQYFRLEKAAWNSGRGEGHRAALKRQTRSKRPPGLLAYVDGEPAGWCAVAPRPEYSRLARSRTLAPVDGKEVWSVVCFFIARKHRGQGLMVTLLREAAKWVRSQGGRRLEGYPIDTGGKRLPAAFAYEGLLPAFLKAGFKEAERRSRTRPILRREFR